MLVLRKGKKILGRYAEPFEAAESPELSAAIPAARLRAVQEFIRREAFTFALYGAKARLGDGIILETEPRKA